MHITPTMGRLLDGTPKRTMGSETEYTTRFASSLVNQVDPELVARFSNSKAWLQNGGLLYLDGQVVEYATPECTSGCDVALHERVGEFVVNRLSDRLQNSSADDTFRHPVYKRTGYGNVFEDKDGERNKILSSQISVGHHETYQTGITKYQLELPTNRRFIHSYLATRPVWSGTGMVTEDGYELSQKASALNFKKDHTLIHGLKTPHRYQGNGLFEIRTGEGSMSEWAIRTKFDMTSLVLRLVEHQSIPKELLVMDGYETLAMRATSSNPRAVIPTESMSLTAIEHQAAIAQAAYNFALAHEVPKAEIQAAEEVLVACQQISDYQNGFDDLSIVSDRIDWAAKLDKLRQRGLKLGAFSTQNLIAVYHDLSWEDVSSSGPARRWYAKHGNERISWHDIRRNTKTAPSERARERVRLHNNMSSSSDMKINWDSIENDEGQFLYSKD